MAVHQDALRTIARWFAPAHTPEQSTTPIATSTPRPARSPHSLNFAALDAEEAQRTRKVGQDLIKFQSVQRGY
jgi:hypothetical protein